MIPLLTAIFNTMDTMCISFYVISNKQDS